jgi:cyclohexa-1,5-dienecarbonyl-CoA hydratase
MESSQAFVTLDIAEDIARVTLNRPPLNVLTLPMIRELAHTISGLTRRAGLKGLALAANGKAFCAGVDVADHTPERTPAMIREFGHLFNALRAFPVPTVAVVQGRALGGGTELAIGCDLVLAGASAQFGQPEIKLGVFPPVAAALLPRLIGYQQAARLIFTGETIGAEEAVRLGLATIVVSDEELPAALGRLLDQLRGLSAAALPLAKRALLLGADLGAAQALPRIEGLYLRDLMATTDACEGIQSFLEKRPPVWAGR